MQKSMPSKGVLVCSSHNPRRGVSSFILFDLERQLPLHSQPFYYARTSSNVLDLIAISRVFRNPIFKKDPTLSIYCANEVAITWAKKGICNTCYFDEQLRPFIEQSIAILGSCEHLDNIKPWDSSAWGKPKDIIYRRNRPGWMGPNGNDDTTPF